MCSHLNRLSLSEAIVLSTHNTPFSIFKKKKKLTLNYPKSSAMGFFLGTQERVQNNRGKRAISVRATEVLLYIGRLKESLTSNIVKLMML